jgi:nucleoside-diphosphate-sugar epimerase
MSTTSNSSPHLSVLQGSTVLVTGASGFIGGHLVSELKALGANVIATDRKPSTGIHGSDVADADQLFQIFKLSTSTYGKSIEYVFHLAGQKSASIAREKPVETLKTSFNGTLNILESSRKLGTVKKVVLISSLAVYGLDEDGSNTLLKESDPVHNDSIYSATKISTEAVGLSYCKDFGIPVCIARLSNVYGPKQSAAAVIPSLISQMKNGGKISMGNTNSIRDFIHVSDVVNGLMELAVSNASTNRVFNVSTGIGTSIKAVTDLLSKNLAYQGDVTIDPAKVRTNEKLTVVADNSEIKKATGWAPLVKIEDGLKNLCQ